MAPNATLALPTIVVGPTDLNRLHRELEALNDYIREAALRKAGEDSSKLPRTSRMLDEFMALNKLNLLQAADRDTVIAFLKQLHTTAPVLHISFAVDPSAAFVDKIVLWLRQNIHPQVLLRVGLQPSIAAGCVVRTPNHQYDFSLRRRFTANRPLLIKKLESLTTP